MHGEVDINFIYASDKVWPRALSTKKSLKGIALDILSMPEDVYDRLSAKNKKELSVASVCTVCYVGFGCSMLLFVIGEGK